MITSKYHIATLVSIFLALGIGLLIGGTMGQGLSVQAENHVAQMLLNKYRDETVKSQKLEKQMHALTSFHLSHYPELEGKSFVWMGPAEYQTPLRTILEAVGVQWMTIPVKELSSIRELCRSGSCPDYFIVADSNQWGTLHNWSLYRETTKSTVNVIHVNQAASLKQLDFIRDFMHFINRLSEEQHHDKAIRFYHYPGVE